MKEVTNNTNIDANNASATEQLAVELFLNENYLFRRNVLSGKVEYSIKRAEENNTEWQTLTQEDLNSIIIQAKRLQVNESGSPKTDIMEFVNSNEVERFDPIADCLSGTDRTMWADSSADCLGWIQN